MRVQTINLNLVPEGISPILHLSQYDKENDGSVIYMIYDGTIPADLTGCTAIIQGTKPDGTAFSYPCSVYTNYVTSAIYSQMTSVAGIYDAEIIITNGEESVGTLNLQISVEKAGVSNIDISNTEIPTMLEEIQTSVDEAEYWAHQAEGAVAGVSKFNGRSGSVMPMAGDYSASMIELENGDNVEERFDNLPDNTTIHYNADGELEVIGGGSGGSTVVVTTSEASLYGATASLSDGEGTPFTAVIDNTGTATFTGVTYTGTVVISASDGSQTAYKDLEIPYFGNYSTTLRFWAAPITITTADAEIQDATITVKKDGVVVGTTQFSSGTATYTAGMTGSYVFSVVYEGTTFNSTPLTVSAETSYSTTIEIWSATVNISTTTADFYGATVTATLDGVSIGSVGTFSNSGALTYIATVAGTYVFTVTSGGETFSSGSINVAEETTYTASINNTFTVTVTLYSAAADTVSYTDANGAQTATTDSSGVLTDLSIEVSVGSPTITFTSGIAKDPEDLTASYSKAVTITEETTEIWLMPTPDKMLYWYGYKADDLMDVTTANGFSWAGSSYGSSANPTYNQNSVRVASGSSSFCGITAYREGTKVCGIIQGVTVLTTSAIQIITNTGKVMTTGGGGYLNITSTSTAYYEFTAMDSATSHWMSAATCNARAAIVYALWYE